jgi:hypothetical protein
MSRLRPWRPARILHAPWNIGGQPVGLSRGEREVGFTSDVLVLDQHAHGYPADIDLDVRGRTDKATNRRRARFVARAALRYDVFHFNFGQTIYQALDAEGVLHTELPWLKRLGKKVLATFQGDDVRPPEANPFAGYSEGGLAEQGVLQAQRRDALLKWADRVFFLNPDLGRWLPGAEFRPYASFEPRSVTPTPLPDGNGLVVAHAPTDRAQKGTDRIVAAVDALRNEGFDVRLELIENATRDEVIERTTAADVVVDQVNIGWYGGYAVEAMALGRPVLAYIREDEPEDNPMGAELPIVRTSADTLRDDLRAVLGDLERRRNAAQASRAFVEAWHDPRRIAIQNLEGLVRIPEQRSALPS